MIKAFPMQYSDGTARSEGMDLRDYFASKAINASMTCIWRDVDYKPKDGFSMLENCAILAYEMADAMMKVRER